MKKSLAYNEKKFQRKMIEKLLLNKYGFENYSGNVGLPSGYSDADFFFIGMNPGIRHNKERYGARCLGRRDKQYKYKGTGGYILISFLEKYYRKNYYTSNLVKIPTENNEEPSFELTQIFLPYLKLEIKIVEPKVIIALGGWVNNILKENNINCIKIYHPSYVARFINKINEYEISIKNLKEVLNEEKIQKQIF